MSIISRIVSYVQTELFPAFEDAFGVLNDKQKHLIKILELVCVEKFILTFYGCNGRPPEDRRAIARAYIAKMVYDLKTTRDLLDMLESSSNFRRICGWNRASEVPSESTFSRAFSEFADTALPHRIHEALIEQHLSERLVGHISRDSTDIEGREKAAKKEEKKKEAAPKRGKGRPKKGTEPPPKEPSRLEKQAAGMALDEMLNDLPKKCDWGTKKKNGKIFHWCGFKLHLDWADGEIPVSVIMTSASVHDSQAAIPLAMMSAERVDSLYDLMDAAYDAEQIRAFSESLGHVPIIDRNPRKGEKMEMDPAAARRFDERTTAERGNSLLKENFGGRNVRVRGDLKVFAHLMFAIVALTADRLLNLVV